MSDLSPSPANIPEPSSDELRFCYRYASRSRAADERIVRLVNQGKVKFAIWGPGEEIHGAATALAFWKAVGGDCSRFGFSAHYRSGALLNTWSALAGNDFFIRDLMRQQFSRASDPYSGGRQMVYHVAQMDMGLLPVQSPVGMQLGKAAGYARGFKLLDIDDGFVCAAIGDGSTAEGDMHDAMNAASVWDLPLCIMVTDNNVAISTTPDEGRGIKDFKAYAEAFGLAYFESDGKDFWDCYNTAYALARHCRENQSGCIWHVQTLPRLNGHSSAGNYRFDLEQPDPLNDFAAELVTRGVLTTEEAVHRIEGKGADYFNHHDMGSLMGAEDSLVGGWMEAVGSEPEPDPASIFEHIRPPFPDVDEPADLMARPTTCVTYAGAIRAAHKYILEHKNAALWGQDLGRLGGVMQATAGLKDLWPERVVDSPLNEPLIVGTACGAALHEDLTILPEIQFGDYSLNAYHWLVYLGNLYWTSLGQAKASLILRTPTDPFGGGAVYHSMCLDGFFTPIPGLVILMPSTSWDAYGLLLAAADYGGPVIVLEPKYCYRREAGPAFPDEPTDPQEQRALRDLVRKGGIPDVGAGVRVPLGKGIIRRPGEDVTVVAWGRAVWTALEAAESLQAQGISLEVIDLRTIVPPDMELIHASVARTGRLLVASEDRPFAGFGRELQGQIVEAFPGTATKVIGMKNVPGIGQSPALEAATVLTSERLGAAAQSLVDQPAARGARFLSQRHLR